MDPQVLASLVRFFDLFGLLGQVVVESGLNKQVVIVRRNLNRLLLLFVDEYQAFDTAVVMAADHGDWQD